MKIVLIVFQVFFGFLILANLMFNLFYAKEAEKTKDELDLAIPGKLKFLLKSSFFVSAFAAILFSFLSIFTLL